MHTSPALAETLAQFHSPLSALEKVFSEAPIGVQIYNASGESVFANAAFLDMFGVAPPKEYSVLRDEVAERTGVQALIHSAFRGATVDLPITWYDPGALQQIKVTGAKKAAIATRLLPITNDRGEVTYVVFFFQDVTDRQVQIDERQKVTKQLNDANSLINDLLNGTRAVIYFKDPNSAYIMVNRQFEENFKIKAEDYVGKTDHDIFPKELADEFRKNDLRVLRAGSQQEIEESTVHADGSQHIYISLKFPLKDSEGKVIGLCGISTDITQSRRMEQELSAARRIESLGVLAGGLAHDFNNLLGVILMHAESLPGADTIKSSAGRASELTRKLLAFGRKQVLKPVAMDLNSVVSGMQDILARMVGEDIQFELKLDAKLNYTYADPSQLEQVLTNLCVNARDAMPRGGRITVSTANVQLTQGLQGRLTNAKPGTYIKLSVRDTGEGIPTEILERIFEPFFTTKEIEKGSGLGLSSVLGIVQQSNGYITVESQLGSGACFDVYLPKFDGEVKVPNSTYHKSTRTGGKETLLIIDDEADLRLIAAKVLRERGYTVFEAADGQQAQEVLNRQTGGIDLIITDVIMPDISGPELIAKLKDLQLVGSAKVLFVSGYSYDKLGNTGFDEGTMHFLEKPYGVSHLASKIRSILDVA